METQVISNTIQKFNGTSYYLCGNYFQRKGVRLHRVVWEYHNGEIPDGYHVHHKDGDKHNNSIENLELLQGSEHSRIHMLKPERVEQSRKTIKFAIEKAKEWHASPEGREWHGKHSKKIWANRKPHKYVCDWCGKEFENHNLGVTSGQHFCCSNHRTYATVWRKKHEGKTNYPHRQG